MTTTAPTASARLSQGAAILAALAVLTTAPLARQQQFGGSYATLSSDQRRLFDDVITRFSRVSNREFTAAVVYDALPLSQRTTFEAVTHALATTPLTDGSGDTFGRAIDLIEGIDEIAGERKEARGDAQFRLYAYLRTDAVALLERSREFRRGADNTVYHQGFPISYRQQGGVPSVQISMARDGRAADIDVDYRSSRFPSALVNGHLTKSNSDIRAGTNAARHNRRWTGLQPWWESFLGLFRAPANDEPAPNRLQIPGRPSRRAKSAEAATMDFLDTWLVRDSPNEAAAYFSPRSFPCVRGAAPADTGFVRYRIATSLGNANREIGRLANLDGVVSAAEAWDPRLTVMRHANPGRFLLARMPATAAPAYECVQDEAVATYGEQFAAAFKLQVPGRPAYTMVLVWAREGKDWRVVAMEAIEAGGMPGAARRVPDAPKAAARVAGDPALIATVKAYYEAWLMARDVDRALTFYRPESWRSSALALDDDGGVSDQAATGKALQRALQETLAILGRRRRLDEMIRGVPPVNPDVAVVTHAHERAFTIVALPEGGGYISYVQLMVPGEPAYLWSRWAKTGPRWQIDHWEVVAP